MVAGLPRVTVHYAQTLDGRIATRTGHSQWISGEETLRLAHQLRAEHEVVMVGVGTVCVDNPRLTVRLVPGSSPLRVVVDSTLRLPLDAHVLSDGAAPTLVATTSRAPAERVRAVRTAGAELLVVDGTDGGMVPLPDVLRSLRERGVTSVLIEGGAVLITSVLRKRLVDRFVVCIAPKVIGRGVEAVGELGIPTMDGAIRFDGASFTPVGEDVVFDGRPIFDAVPH